MTDRRTYSIGHGTRTSDAFFAVLETWGIRRLVDVRRFPVSRRHPQFSREALERECGLRGIDYVWMGDALGGFRDGGYESHLRTAEFADALGRLETLARERATAFLCAEKEPTRCHRRFIAQELARRGWSVSHLLDERSAVAEGAQEQQGELW